MDAAFNILLSSAGHRVERVKIMRATLADLRIPGKIIASDVSRLSAAGQVADALEIVPRCHTAEFIPALLDACQRHAIRLLIPGIDTELAVLAAARDEFAAVGTTVLVSSPETVAIGGDKIRTHAWLTSHGFPTVRQATAEEVLSQPFSWTFPLLAKPAAGSASVGVARVESADELRHVACGGGYIVQTIATGHEYTVDVLVNRAGKCVCAIPRRRIEVRSGEVFKGVTERQKDVIALATRIAEALPGAYGPLNVQMFHDATVGRADVIEINPRFGGGFPLAWQAGGKYPRWVIEEIRGMPSTASADAWQTGLVMLRHFDAVFVDTERLE